MIVKTKPQPKPAKRKTVRELNQQNQQQNLGKAQVVIVRGR